MTHYPNLAAAAVAACDRCGGPARPTPDAFYQAYRRPEGFVFLCAICIPGNHAAYHATRVAAPFRIDKSEKRSTWS